MITIVYGGVRVLTALLADLIASEVGQLYDIEEEAVHLRATVESSLTNSTSRTMVCSCHNVRRKTHE